uniref:Zinc finger protein n=1 Tax=Schistosoma mansoni TaxID=6183 RepID=A0A5K4F043_SCHMA
MNEQQTFPITTTILDVTTGDGDTAVIDTMNISNSYSPNTPSKIELLSNLTDKEKKFEHELDNNNDYSFQDDEQYHRHIQDMMIDQNDGDNITEDTDDQEYQDDLNQSNKMDTFNFNYSLSNPNDSDDSLKQLTNTTKDTGKSIYSKSNNNDDKRPRKFICRYCNKAFSLMNVLKVHERIHTGEKPYVCEICNKAFNQSGSLNRHKNTHTKRSSDNRSYSCRFCPRQFLHSSQLQDHETMEHSMEMNISITKSNDTKVTDYTIKLPTSSLPTTSLSTMTVTETITTITEGITTDCNLLKQNHLSSQLLHNKSIINNNTLKLSSSEHNNKNFDKNNINNPHSNNIDTNDLDNNNNNTNSMSLLNSTQNLFDFDNKKLTGLSNKFPFPYGLNLISKFLPVSLADEFIKSLDHNNNNNNNNGNMDGSLHHLPITTTNTITPSTIGITSTNTISGINIPNIMNPINKGILKQDFSDNTNTFTCTLCSTNLSSKTELDLHWGQHFIQQMEAQLGPISNSLLPSSSISNPLNPIHLNPNTSFNDINSNLPLLFTSSTQNTLKSTEQTDLNKMLPENPNTTYPFDNCLSNTSIDNISLLNSTNMNSAATAAAAAAASAAMVTALSQFLLGNTPGQSLPNPSLLAATAALTNPELLNTLMNTLPPTITTTNTNTTANTSINTNTINKSDNNNTPAIQSNINELNPNHFNKLLNSLTNVHNHLNFPRSAALSNDIAQKLLDIDTNSFGLKDHALNFIINKACNISPDSLTKSPTSSSPSLSSSISPSAILTTTMATTTMTTSISQNYSSLSHLNQKTPSSLSTHSIWPCNLELDFTNRSIINPLQSNCALNQLFTELDTNLSMNMKTSTNSFDPQMLSTMNLSTCKNNSYITENSFKLNNSRHLSVDSENYSSDLEGGGGGGEGVGGIGGGNLTDSTLSGSFNTSKRKRSNSPNNSADNSKSRKCNFCNKQFNCTSALRIHYRKHSGERPYICRHCGKAFSQNGTLKRHSQTCKAAYNKNNSNTNINNNGHNNNENRDAHFDQKFPMSTPTTHHQSSFIKNISNNITDPINLKPSNFSTLLCNPIDGLSDNEGQMNLSQSISNSNHVKTTLPTTMNSINTTMNIIENNKTNVNKLSNQYIYPELNEKQLHNLEKSQIWENCNIKLEEGNCSSLSKTTLSSIATTRHESNVSNPFKQQQQQQQSINVGSTFNIQNQPITLWSNFDWTKLTNHEIKLLLEKLHSLGKLYGCIDCQTYYLDEKMANYHLSSMHGNLKNQSSSSSLLDSVDNSSKKFECFLCGVNLNNSLLFLEHFTHCLSLKKHNGIDLMMKQTTTDSLTILSDNKTTDNNKNTCNELDENEDENINEQSVNEPTQITNTTSQELHTVSSIIDNCNDNNNNNNDNNDPVLLNSINDQSEIKLNGYCIEETIELHEKDDDLHISSPCSIIVSNSVDQLNGKSIDNL